MKKTWLVISVIAIFSFLVLPSFSNVARAADPESISIWPLGFWGPLVACNGDICDSLCDLLDLGQRLTAFGISLAIFGIAPVMIVYGGIMMMFAGASEERWKSGKKALTAAVVGIALALGAYLILYTFLWALGVATDGTDASVPWPAIQCSVPGLNP